MLFSEVYFSGLIVILVMMFILWVFSVILKNVSIVDYFWGPGFILAATYYYLNSDGNIVRKNTIFILTIIWGLRLAVYLLWRNRGKGEDFRYRQFRESYGEHRYWWISFFQTFMLQGILMWLISAPLLGAMYYGKNIGFGFFDIAGIIFWLTGLFFEAVGDLQMARFKAADKNKGTVMNKGLWRYTRHPNYFGDTSVWWGYGLICLAAASYLPVLGSLLMTALIIKVSGVALLEKSMVERKPDYKEYIEKTSAFIPWFPKK